MVALLLRIDQLLDAASGGDMPERKRGRGLSAWRQGGRALGQEEARPEGLDIAGMISELDMDLFQRAEHRALSLLVSRCRKESAALVLLMRLLLRHATNGSDDRCGDDLAGGSAWQICCGHRGPAARLHHTTR